MTRARRQLTPLGLFLFAALASPQWASAQSAQRGIQAGNFVLHPGAFFAAGWDDNIFYENDTGAQQTENPDGAAVFKFGGSLEAENRNANKMKLQLGLGINLRQYTGFEPNAETQAQRLQQEDAVNARNGVESGSIDGRLTLFPKNSVAFRLVERLRFSDTPALEVTVIGFEKLDNQIGGDVIFQPGSNPLARALSMSLGYRLHTISFFDASAINAGRAQMTTHKTRLLTRLKLFPKTTALLDVQWSFADYGESFSGTDEAGNSVADPTRDGKPLTVQLGLQGLISRRISTNLRAGYANTFNDEGASYSGFVGLAEFQYKLQPSLAFTAGAEWNVSGSNFSNYVVQRGAYTALDLYFQKVFVKTKLGYNIYDYSDSGRRANVPSREDPILRARAELGYNLQSWMQVKVVWAFEDNATDFVSPTNAPVNEQDQAAYTRQLTMLQVEARY
ncbi:MAG: hypothetical protein ACE366_17000 [Bradymonadia bacterium]